MEFGYFTLSDNRYPDNPRSAETFMREIRDQAVFAESLGMNSAWIGEHHFNRRGCVPMPSLVLASVAAATTRIRLGPAVVVLPIHHPVQVAEEWASLDVLSGGRVDFALGRGYDSHEYAPFGADFQASAEVFAEGVELLYRCWNDNGPTTFEGEHYKVHDIEICPKPAQKPFVPYMGSFSRYSMEVAARYRWNLMLAPFAAALVFGGLDEAVAAYREVCDAAETEPGRVKCSYFVHIADTPTEETAERDRLLDYFTMSGTRHKGIMGAKLPPTMEYYRRIGKALADLGTEDLGPNSILLGPPQAIVDRLGEVADTGIEEVILYFNYGRKPDAMVRDQMERFMAEVAPALGNATGRFAASERTA